MTTLMYFTAVWCQPCKRFGPVMEAVEQETGVAVTKVDIDEQPELAQQYSVQSVPTVVKVDESYAEVARIVGAKPKAVAMRELNI